MAKRGDGGGLMVVLGFAVAAGLLIYLKTGRGETDSPFLPNAIEDRIDRVVSALNQIFGPRWVTYGMNVLQSRLEAVMPGTAALVDVVYRAEQAYASRPNAGWAKKQYALHLARR
jgi:hypothetical protein